MQQITEASLIYYARRQCSEQWRVFLSVLADELAAQMDVPERRQLMHALGRRMAAKLPHPQVASLADLQREINLLWEQMEWGYIRLREEEGYIALTHSCAPLRAAFGPSATQWAPALLEGIYAHWFEAFGAGDELELVQISAPRGSDDSMEFRLGREEVVASAAH